MNRVTIQYANILTMLMTWLFVYDLLNHWHDHVGVMDTIDHFWCYEIILAWMWVDFTKLPSISFKYAYLCKNFDTRASLLRSDLVIQDPYGTWKWAYSRESSCIPSSYKAFDASRYILKSLFSILVSAFTNVAALWLSVLTWFSPFYFW